ncbi:YciI family protein [Stenotrophomonas sp. PS02298]|uniref:YciI family protein n=1 Tax=Stenotrophomonas sp. PS02298 TaxID=2991424 RepID=UPI00249BB11A|nr:YciI family protein [Stenotrophomonas sp. PS02298]
MKVMVLVKATPETEAGVMPTEAEIAAMGAFNEELVKAGIMLAGEGLKPTSQAARVRFAAEGRSVIDGPFAETRELVAGFWLWQVRSLDEAVEWLKRAPFTPANGSAVEVEIRPFFEAEDFGAAFTPELQAQEQRLREQIERNN